MKRFLSIALIIIMVVAVLVGCVIQKKGSLNEIEKTSQEKNGDNLVSHIQISSGSESIRPFGCLIWSKTDNGNGTYTETDVDKYDIVDLVNGKTAFSADDIPSLVLNNSVEYAVQVNGKVENVFLLSHTANGYSKEETSFAELSDLSDGTYYVVFEVLLDGNCDPDSPQNSYRYEDVFRLIVGKQNYQTNQFGDVSDEIVPYDSQLLNIKAVNGKLVYPLIATLPCIVYSDTEITDMNKGTVYSDGDDILTAVFKATNGKSVITETAECDFSHYIYMFDNKDETIPWHYMFAICDCGAVRVTNNGKYIGTVMISQEEMQSILNTLK